MNSFTLSMNDVTLLALDKLQKSFGKTSHSEVFYLAIALLYVSAEALEQGKQIAILDQSGKVESILNLHGQKPELQ